MPELRLATETAAATSETEKPKPKTRKTDVGDYDPLGVDLGGLRLFTQLEISGTGSSNVTQKTHGTDYGGGLMLKPSLRFESDWVRHSWTGQASGNFLRYLDHPEMAAESVDASTTFRLDIRRHTTAEFDAGYDLSVDANRDSGVVGSEKGDATLHTLSSGASLTHDFGPVQTRVGAVLSHTLYGDVALSGGGTRDNGDRDYYQPSVSLRATYSDPPLLKPFVEVSYEPRLHDQKLDRNGENRNSNGYSAKIGVSLDDGPIWTGDLAATYLRRDYADGNLSSNDAVGLSGSLTWSPTELTKLSLNVGTALTESTTKGYSGGRSWNGGISFTQSVRDNVDLTAGGGVTFEEVSAGTDVTYDGSLGMLWKLNRNFALTAGYDFTRLDAAIAADSYIEHRVSAGVVLRR